MNKYKTNVLLLSGAVAFTFIVFEIFLRILGIGWPIFTQVDELTGFSLRPNAQGWNTDENKAYVSINSDGWRDVEHGSKNGLRIAVIGDSFTEARQVDMQDTFWSQVHCAEVMNFGVSGFGTAQEYLLLRDRVLSYEPDIVVLAFFPGNDIENNSYDLSHADVPYFIDGEFVFDFRNSSFYVSQQRWYNRAILYAINRSRVFQLFNRLRKITVVRQQEHVNTQQPVITDPYGEPSTEEWAEAWETTEELIRMINDISPQLTVLMVSSWQQIHPDLAPDSLDVLYPNRRIAVLAEELGFSLIDPVPELQRRARENGEIFHGFTNTPGPGHWNQHAHKVVGDILATQLCSTP